MLDPLSGASQATAPEGCASENRPISPHDALEDRKSFSCAGATSSKVARSSASFAGLNFFGITVKKWMLRGDEAREPLEGGGIIPILSSTWRHQRLPEAVTMPR
ncbi:hypothetical protein [Microvirga sp. Mcv34]|uniref:hypothetical protein n=1 Tax=Microvirga sp. Mcv34 TaxID=2926016 RepID=UPI0021C929E7|nr:hypothetical protein [Microvirga sp. Mcv34]